MSIEMSGVRFSFRRSFVLAATSIGCWLIGGMGFAVAGGMKNSLYQTASFEETWQRYPSARTIYQTMKTWFVLGTSSSGPREIFCEKVGSSAVEAGHLLGSNLPLTGRPVSSLPNANFVSWYAKCLTALMSEERLEVVGRSNEERTAVLGATLTSLGSDALGDGFDWNRVSVQDKQRIATELIELMLGPAEVRVELGLPLDVDPWVSSMIKTVDDAAASRLFPLSVGGDGHETVSVLKGAQMVKYMIAMKDVLRF